MRAGSEYCNHCKQLYGLLFTDLDDKKWYSLKAVFEDYKRETTLEFEE